MNEQSLVIRNSGCDFVNGTYFRDQNYNNKEMWTKNEGEQIQIWWNHNQWRIGVTNKYVYCIDSNDSKPPLNGWKLSSSLVSSNLCDPRSKLPTPILEIVPLCNFNSNKKNKSHNSKILDPNLPITSTPYGAKEYIPPKNLELGLFGFNPNNIKAFIVGFCNFQNSSDWESIQRKDHFLAQNLISHGVPIENIALLMDNLANNENIFNSLIKLLKFTNQNDFLFLYYGSHGNISNYNKKSLRFSTYSSTIYFKELMDLIIKHFKGSHCFITIDTCYSGSSISIVEEYSKKSNIIFSVLSSTSEYQIAYSGWRFCRCLVHLFEGNYLIDKENKGFINFKDFIDYTVKQMSYLANGHPLFFTNGFNLESKIINTLKDESNHFQEKGEFIHYLNNQNYLSTGLLLNKTHKGFLIELTSPYESNLEISTNLIRIFKHSPYSNINNQILYK